jgi:hypothetical protein
MEECGKGYISFAHVPRANAALLQFSRTHASHRLTHTAHSHMHYVSLLFWCCVSTLSIARPTRTGLERGPRAHPMTASRKRCGLPLHSPIVPPRRPVPPSAVPRDGCYWQSKHPSCRHLTVTVVHRSRRWFGFSRPEEAVCRGSP